MYKKLFSAMYIAGVSLFSLNISAFDWPEIDSRNTAHHPVIEKFINNALKKMDSFKYIGHLFRVRDENNNRIDKNTDLYNKANELYAHFLNGSRIKIIPTSSKEIFEQFTEKCLYDVYVDGDLFIKNFRIFFAGQGTPQFLNNNNHDHVVPNNPGPVVPVVVQNNLPTVDSNLVSGWYDRPLGRCTPGNVTIAKVKSLLNKYKNHHIIKHVLNFMKAADLADIQDPILLADFIQHHGAVSKTDVLNAMNDDKDRLTQAKNLGLVSEGHEERGLDFGNQLSYPKTWMANAMQLIKDYPSLLQGQLHNNLKSLKGYDAQTLLQAQYYIAAVQAKKNNHQNAFKKLLSKIGGLYAHDLPSVTGPQTRQLKTILEQMALVVDNCFYTPAHNYIKHGDVTREVKQEIANLPNNLQAPNTYENIYTDCSGLSIMVLRKLFPDYDWIQNDRAMSWQFAIAYDYLVAGNRTPTKYVENNREYALTREEKDRLSNYNLKIGKNLAVMLEPVTHYNDRQAGDIVVDRRTDGGEGHVMTIVDPFPNPNDSSEVIIAEMTQYSGTRNGLNWRTMKIKRDGYRTRLLRPKM